MSKKKIPAYPNVLIDSCIFIDAIKPTERHHADARQVFEFADQGSLKIAVSTVIIAEMTYLDENDSDKKAQINKIRGYLNRGYIEPGLAMPVTLGVLAGAMLGARYLARASTDRLRLIFAAVVASLAVQMIYSSLTGRLK